MKYILSILLFVSLATNAQVGYDRYVLNVKKDMPLIGGTNFTGSGNESAKMQTAINNSNGDSTRIILSGRLDLFNSNIYPESNLYIQGVPIKPFL